MKRGENYLMQHSKFVYLASLFLALYIIVQFPISICLADTSEPNCASCHEQQSKEFKAGVHSQNGMSCTDCHQVHDTNGGAHQDPMSIPQNIPETCGACHKGDVAKSYEDSFHGRALALGSIKTADCTSCHDSHNIIKAADPASPVAQANIPATCGKCHEEPIQNYAAGTEHKVLASTGAGKPQYNTLKFFVWLTIISVVCLILHMEMELLHMFKKAKR